MLKHSTYFNIKWLTVAVTFTATVVFLTHIPQEAMPSQLQVIGLDKLTHALAYGAITYLFVLSLRTCPTMLSSLLLFFAILALGAIDELTQPLVNRTASLADWLANLIGVSGVLLFFLRFKRPGYQLTLTTQPLRPNTRLLTSDFLSGAFVYRRTVSLLLNLK